MSADDERWQPNWPPQASRPKRNKPPIKSFTRKPDLKPITKKIRIRIPRAPKDHAGVLSPRHRFFTVGHDMRRQMAAKWFGIYEEDEMKLVRLVKNKFDELGYRDEVKDKMLRFRNEERKRRELWEP